MKRLLFFLLGIALLAVTGVVLLRYWHWDARGSLKNGAAATRPLDDAGSEEPDIDSESRKKLEAVLEENESDEISPESKTQLEAVLNSGTQEAPSEGKQ